mmetsp:Transcript_3985/g.8591  ORF Transcript_3985/g.8591 Transcript_3985/m.8591 type:complete len:233 (-) Transcript_3985:729-1427(-)
MLEGRARRGWRTECHQQRRNQQPFHTCMQLLPLSCSSIRAASHFKHGWRAEHAVPAEHQLQYSRQYRQQLRPGPGSCSQGLLRAVTLPLVHQQHGRMPQQQRPSHPRRAEHKAAWFHPLLLHRPDPPLCHLFKLERADAHAHDTSGYFPGHMYGAVQVAAEASQQYRAHQHDLIGMLHILRLHHFAQGVLSFEPPRCMCSVAHGALNDHQGALHQLHVSPWMRVRPQGYLHI